MKETRMPPAKAANLVANSGNTIYGFSVINGLATNKNALRWEQVHSLVAGEYITRGREILAAYGTRGLP